MAYDHNVWDPTRRIAQNIQSAQSNDAIITDILEVNAVGVDGNENDRGKLTHTRFLPQTTSPSTNDFSIYVYQDSRGGRRFYQRIIKENEATDTPLMFNLNEPDSTDTGVDFSITNVITNYGTTMRYGSSNRTLNLPPGFISFSVGPSLNLLRGSLIIGLDAEHIRLDLEKSLIIVGNNVRIVFRNETIVNIGISYRFFLEYLNTS